MIWRELRISAAHTTSVRLFEIAREGLGDASDVLQALNDQPATDRLEHPPNFVRIGADWIVEAPAEHRHDQVDRRVTQSSDRALLSMDRAKIVRVGEAVRPDNICRAFQRAVKRKAATGDRARVESSVARVLSATGRYVGRPVYDVMYAPVLVVPVNLDVVHCQASPNVHEERSARGPFIQRRQVHLLCHAGRTIIAIMLHFSEEVVSMVHVAALLCAALRDVHRLKCPDAVVGHRECAVSLSNAEQEGEEQEHPSVRLHVNVGMADIACERRDSRVPTRRIKQVWSGGQLVAPRYRACLPCACV